MGAQFTVGSLFMLLLFPVFYYILNQTAWGRHVYAVGDDAESAKLSGIRTDRVLLVITSYSIHYTKLYERSMFVTI